jgi:hypothetical protein
VSERDPRAAAARRAEDRQRPAVDERAWRLLWLIAQQGRLTAAEVTGLMFGSRATASRHLRGLLKAGLLSRSGSVMPDYALSPAGMARVRQRLGEAGQPLPVALDRRGHSDGESFAVEFFAALVRYARTTGRGYLYRFRHALDTAVWLRAHGVQNARTVGDGLWIEDGVAASFVLHLDRGGYPPPVLEVSAYRDTPGGVPVQAALVVTPNEERERLLHQDLAQAPVPVVVASATLHRLARAASPADAIWMTRMASAPLLRLIEIPADSGQAETLGAP